jgi:Amt family ammonium transporter
MTPGLAIFYGGMVRTTGVLNMIMMSFISIPLVTVAWLLVGYSLAFSDGGVRGFVGGLTHAGLQGIGPDMLGWLSVEQFRDGKPTTFGAASGVVAGLVGITPSCGTVNPLGAAIVGLLAGIVCSFAIGLKFKLNYDDSLDVVGVHFVGGVVGMLLIGLLATEVMTGGAQGFFFGGGLGLLGKQAMAIAAVAGYAFTVSYAIAALIEKLMGFRLSAEDEASGVDFTQHAETAYAEGVYGQQQSRRSLFAPRPDGSEVG